jgi:predicted MFS family arabinose efflux permease
MGGRCALAEEDAFPGLRHNWWPLLLLFLAANIYSIDKAIVGILAEPIKADFHVTDVQMGLVLGLAYSLLSGICGLWLGSLVDRHVRRNVLVASIMLWSLSTIAGGLSSNFHWFFGFRMLVGLGEAAVGPAAVSLIADMFPPHQRGRGLSCYFIGATFGTALSSIVPGVILGANLRLPVPGFGAIAPWRSTFVMCGMVGPVISLLFLTVREPVRRGARMAQGASPRIDAKLRYLAQHGSVMVPLISGFCLYYVAFIGIVAWTAPFVMRAYGLTLPQFAGRMGLIMLVGGVAGYVCGGLIADSGVGRQRGGKALIMIVLPFVAMPAAFAVFAPNATVALIALATLSLATPMLNVAMNASLQELVPNEMRGFSQALLSVVSALPAGAGGPFAIAYVTQNVLQDPARIGTSFVIVGVPSLLASSLCFILARRAQRN